MKKLSNKELEKLIFYFGFLYVIGHKLDVLIKFLLNVFFIILCKSVNLTESYISL